MGGGGGRKGVTLNLSSGTDWDPSALDHSICYCGHRKVLQQEGATAWTVTFCALRAGSQARHLGHAVEQVTSEGSGRKVSFVGCWSDTQVTFGVHCYKWPKMNYSVQCLMSGRARSSLPSGLLYILLFSVLKVSMCIC